MPEALVKAKEWLMDLVGKELLYALALFSVFYFIRVYVSNCICAQILDD